MGYYLRLHVLTASLTLKYKNKKMKNSFKLIAVAVALTAAVACSGNKAAETATDAVDTTATAVVDTAAAAAAATIDTAAAAATTAVDTAAAATK